MDWFEAAFQASKRWIREGREWPVPEDQKQEWKTCRDEHFLAET